MINSNLVSAQNRARIYWTNIDWIEQPQDEWLFLKDVMLGIVDIKYYLKEETLNKIANWKSQQNPLKKIYNDSDKSSTLTARWAWEMYSWMLIYNTRIPITKFNQDNVFCWYEDKVPTLTAWDWHNRPKTILRRLTPVECERLQNIEDWYTEWVTDRQRYKMIWNWWTVNIIKHIFSYIKHNNA